MRVLDERRARRRAIIAVWRAALRACSTLAVAGALGCQPAADGAPAAAPTGAPVPDEPVATVTQPAEAAQAVQRTVALGYEDVADEGLDLDAVAGALDDLGATTVALSAGRADWTTFRWAGHEDRWATPTAAGEADPFTRAAATLGEGRNVVAVVDVFASGYLGEHPGAAAVDADGDASDFQVSLVELTEGEHGDALVEMVGALAARDDVDAVSLTELHYDDAGLGADDEAAFAADTGAAGWPRDADGDIDWRDEDVAVWRSERVAGLVERAAAAAHDGGAELLVDVRSPRDGGTAIHGQDYRLLLEHADRLVIWYYPGLSAGDGSQYPVRRVAAEAARAAGSESLDRFVLSVGLWANGDEVLAAEELGAALEGAAAAGFARTWVTPWSLMGEDHRNAAGDAWG